MQPQQWTNIGQNWPNLDLDHDGVAPSDKADILNHLFTIAMFELTAFCISNEKNLKYNSEATQVKCSLKNLGHDFFCVSRSYTSICHIQRGPWFILLTTSKLVLKVPKM